MIYKVEFQVKKEGDSRPEDCVQDEELVFEGGEFLPLPDVGDTVDYLYGDEAHAFKVLTRHFSYRRNWCIVNIVVTPLDEDEMLARLKS